MRGCRAMKRSARLQTAVCCAFICEYFVFTSFAAFRACLFVCSSPSWAPRRRCTRPSAAGPCWAEPPAGRWCRPSAPASASSSSAVRTLCQQERRSLQSECGCRWRRSVGRTCCGSARLSTRQTSQSSSSKISLSLKNNRKHSVSGWMFRWFINSKHCFHCQSVCAC